MDEAQAAAAFGLMAATLSTRGFETSRDIMRLEGHLADLLDDHDEYGERRYWFTVMGEPSDSSPWGWQLDGHHLVVNCFVLGDQVVLTPTFMGSEPMRADTGRFAGTAILEEELAAGIMIEYDHLGPVALDGPRGPSRDHVHTVVRTPNGNDYGKDLLRQHLLEHPH